ncbi:hypothetical protein D3C86_2268070 [compost metagenome]
MTLEIKLSDLILSNDFNLFPFVEDGATASESANKNILLLKAKALISSKISSSLSVVFPKR